MPGTSGEHARVRPLLCHFSRGGRARWYTARYACVTSARGMEGLCIPSLLRSRIAAAWSWGAVALPCARFRVWSRRGRGSRSWRPRSLSRWPRWLIAGKSISKDVPTMRMPARVGLSSLPPPTTGRPTRRCSTTPRGPACGQTLPTTPSCAPSTCRRGSGVVPSRSPSGRPVRRRLWCVACASSSSDGSARSGESGCRPPRATVAPCVNLRHRVIVRWPSTTDFSNPQWILIDSPRGCRRLRKSRNGSGRRSGVVGRRRSGLPRSAHVTRSATPARGGYGGL